MSSQPYTLFFGIEWEFLMKPKPKMKPFLRHRSYRDDIQRGLGDDSDETKKNRTAILYALADVLRSEDIKANTFGADPKAWSVTDEFHIAEKEGFWRVELISRILSTQNDWQREVDLVYSVVTNHCDVQVTIDCSTHIHISPGIKGKNNTLFTVAQIQDILKHTIYNDQTMRTIVPPERRNNRFCPSNLSDNHDWRRMYDEVGSKTWAPIFDALDEQKTQEKLLEDWVKEKKVAWNFKNLEAGDSRTGTVEFRLPPGSDKASEAKHWAAVALGCVAHAIYAQPWEQIRDANTYPTMENLIDAIEKGLNYLGPYAKGALHAITIDNKSRGPFTNLKPGNQGPGNLRLDRLNLGQGKENLATANQGRRTKTDRPKTCQPGTGQPRTGQPRTDQPRTGQRKKD